MCATKPSPKNVETRPLGAVEELIGNDELERAVLLLERADGAERDDPLDAELLEALDIGAEIELRRRDAMAASVTRQERHLLAGERADDVGSDGLPQGVSTACSSCASNPGIE